MSKALELLTSRLQEAEDRAAKMLAQAQMEQANFKRQLDALNEYRQIYSTQMTDKGVAGLEASHFNHYHSFIGKLDHASTQQQQGFQRARQQAEEKREEWLALQQRRKAIEMLLERKAQKEALKQLKQEQKLLDEFATFRFFHRQESAG
ncbi:flagellar export protein FliJ [Tolumonas lignilytica]|jgi:flagellar export protein FliJ|uniref:flagellar export protein FliJ n=1 Tax=Tolumonas lignilytica TaxID=1283284 RepID=UPI000465B44B|nr:flagellar export protein FliJ [Tolumonas lignilytica]